MDGINTVLLCAAIALCGVLTASVMYDYKRGDLKQLAHALYVILSAIVYLSILGYLLWQIAHRYL